MKDDEKAALTLDTHVEDEFTHSESIRLHLDMITVFANEAEEVLDNGLIDKIWKTMLDEKSKSIPSAKSIVLNWFIANFDIIDRKHLTKKLRSAGENVNDLSEYHNACDVFM